jgi:NAD-dependent oxidoreductase involved in siderophore biosynthesis
MSEQEELAVLEAELKAFLTRMDTINDAPAGLRETASFIEWITTTMQRWADRQAPVTAKRSDLMVRALSDVWSRLGSVAGNYLEVAMTLQAKAAAEPQPEVKEMN